MSIELWEIVLGVGVLLVSWLLKRAEKLSFIKEHEAALLNSVIAAAQRTKDKFMIELDKATLPDSDGGVEITKAELSAARASAYRLVLDSLKGPALKYAKDRGEHYIKGLLGKVFEKYVKLKE